LRKNSCFITIIILSVLIGCTSELPSPHNQEGGVFSGRRNFPFKNFTLLTVDTGKQKAAFEFREYTGSGLQAPFAELNIKIGHKEYKVTSKGVGNGHLMVNGVVYAFYTFKEHLLIDRDGKIVVEQGEVHHGIKPLIKYKNR